MPQGDSSSLGGVSAIVDILWGVDSGLVLKKITYYMDNVMSIEIIPTNNNIIFIETIGLNSRVWYIHSGKFVNKHVGRGYNTNPVFFFLRELPFVLDHMTPPVF